MFLGIGQLWVKNGENQPLEVIFTYQLYVMIHPREI